jgi:hypothetical protein
LVSRKSEYKQIIMPTLWEETHHWMITSFGIFIYFLFLAMGFVNVYVLYT